MGNIHIDSAGVRGAAADTEALSRQVSKRLDHALDDSEGVHSSHYGNGWTSPAQLKACAEKWENHMVGLAKRMGDLSRRLKESADGYDRADAEADSRLNAGLRDLGQV
ncbi:WXG100 family type VII secretion target [Streptomyces marispadix]|uniref:ESX-1 secretion-associated protein n=1 Tax=Streptomyces marispadix TaxID=2922868 RepID=A0ABS9SUD9_9ACTN|nr:type VII secretion target [Streptomyces marispadix]MCH6159651.1 ESX-1 secretion-associated protein [Streptomyces marispadix]